MSKVYVFGSINMDVVGFTTRHPTVGETIKGSDLHLLPGGKGANQAVAAKRAGAHVELVGCLGDDAFATELRAFLSQEGVGLTLVSDRPGVSTGTALITVASSDNTIVVIPGANDELKSDVVHTVDIGASDVVVAQFETPQSTTVAAFAKAQTAGATTILNPAPAEAPEGALLSLTDLLILNETELAALSALDGAAATEPASPEQAARVASDLASRHAGLSIVVTLGAAGAVVCDSNCDVPYHVPGRRVEAVDTTGAGDCFVGNVAAHLVGGGTIRDAAERANLAASLCVQTIGATPSMPTTEMLERIQTV